MLIVTPVGIGLASLALLVLAWQSPAVETNTLQQPAGAGTNAVAAQYGTNQSGRLQAVGPGALPRLQRRKRPDLPPPPVLSAPEQAQLQSRHPALRGMPPNRLPPGTTNGPAGFDPRQPEASQYGITSHHAPPSVLKKYDRDKNGLLDPAEWHQYRQDLEKQVANRKRLQASTNPPPTTVSTNKTANTP